MYPGTTCGNQSCPSDVPVHEQLTIIRSGSLENPSRGTGSSTAVLNLNTLPHYPQPPSTAPPNGHTFKPGPRP
eukprot:2059168-Alexandrium_andersonii.AAC.1